MIASGTPQEPGLPQRTAAFAVHVFTACGAACALLALTAAAHADWPAMFAWLGVALFIVLIGIPVLWAVAIWTLYRIIKGWLYLYDNKPLADPRSWF